MLLTPQTEQADLEAVTLPPPTRATQRIRSLTARIRQLEAQQRSLHARVRDAEAAMLHSARLATVGRFTAALTHEINNRVAAIESASYLLSSLSPDTPRFMTVIELLHGESQHLIELTTRMRNFYRADLGEHTPCELSQLLREVLKLAELEPHTGKVALTLVAPAAPVVIKADAVQLRQLFLNLVLNGIDAMPREGTLTVRLESMPLDVRVEVCDTGAGIAPDIRPHLFEPFATSKPSGTGLGLFISAQIVAQHAGRIEVDSACGEGSVFRVILPRLLESTDAHASG